MTSIDIRQFVAAILTFSMFIMLGNMIKKDYFNPPTVDDLSSTNIGYNVTSKWSQTKGSGPNGGPWKANIEAIKPCWDKPVEKRSDQPKGYIIFSLTGRPHHHLLQVSNAVLIARKVNANLVLPIITGNIAGEKREFGEVYDVRKFITSLEGIVKLAYQQPPELSAENLSIARIPIIISEDYITSKIEPLFKRKGNLRLVTDFATSNVTKVQRMQYVKSVLCTVVFEALQLQAALQELVNSVLEKLATINPQSDGRFVAVDWRSEIFGLKRCQGTTSNGRNSCFSAEKIGQFLKKIGFGKNITIYFTQNGWDYRLDELTNIYPNTFTKESLIPPEKMAKFSGFTDEIDFYVCSHSDVFVPGFSQFFYEGVVGQRIALGKTQIFDPSQATSSNAEDFLSPYVSKKSHWAYSCFC